MQLPRGTFREIKKNQRTADVLEELERGRFSGICSISCRDELGTLVMKSGKCILAEYGSWKGEAALEKLLYAFSEEGIDAALSSLDEAQIQLSLEFNKTERIHRTVPAPPATNKTVPHIAPSYGAGAQNNKISPLAHRTPASERPVVLMSHPPEKVHRPLASPKNPVREPPVSIRAPPLKPEGQVTKKESNTAQTATESDLDTFDSMNLDEVTGKFREECKTMVKNLHLEHLMDRK